MTVTTPRRRRQAMAPVEIPWPDEATTAPRPPAAPALRSPAVTAAAGMVVGLVLGLALHAGAAPAGTARPVATAPPTTTARTTPSPPPQATVSPPGYGSANAAERRAFEDAAGDDAARTAATATWPRAWRESLDRRPAVDFPSNCVEWTVRDYRVSREVAYDMCHPGTATPAPEAYGGPVPEARRQASDEAVVAAGP